MTSLALKGSGVIVPVSESADVLMGRWLKTRTVILCISAALCVLSDCASLLGAWAYGLKLVGIALFVLFGLKCAFFERIPRVNMILCIVGVLLLILELPFQTADFSAIEAIMLYMALALVVLVSRFVVRDSIQLYYCGITLVVLIGALLLVSYSDCIAQWSTHAAHGRPRLKGCFSNENSLGNISAIVFIMLAIPLLQGNLRWKERRIGAIALAASSLYLLLSGSRTAWAVAGVFALLAVYLKMERRFKKGGSIVLGRLLIVAAVTSIALFSFDAVMEDFFKSGRVVSFSFEDPIASTFGFGYASSERITEITSRAGGNTEMLWVSMFYRVGILGYAAYAILLTGAVFTRGKKLPLRLCFLAALFMQAMGESYMTSVMSFPSFFGWVMLGSIGAFGSFSSQLRSRFELDSQSPCSR